MIEFLIFFIGIILLIWVGLHHKNSRKYKICFIIYVLLISIIFYFYACFEASENNNSNAFINTKNQIWPEHWKFILYHSNDLQLILLDSDALKCVYENLDESHKKGCQALFGNKVMRLGTTIADFQKFIQTIDFILIKNSEVEITIEEFLPNKNPDTIILKYKLKANYNKFIFITQIQFPLSKKNNKNFHLHRGGNIATTIGIREFEINSIYLNYLNINILVPKNIEKYLFFYENGEFLECNKTLALRRVFEEQNPSSPLNENPTIPPDAATKLLSELIDEFIEMGQIPFMSFGTLLGWYRDCSYIPFTNDIDFYIFANEYIDDFEQIYINHTKTPVSRKIGKKEHGLELTFKLQHNFQGYNATLLDFFYLYENNHTTQWSSILLDFSNLARARCVIPKVEKLCTGSLYGYLFFIPCNYMKIIEATFGPKWNIPNKNAGYFDDGMQTFFDGFWNLSKDEIIKYF